MKNPKHQNHFLTTLYFLLCLNFLTAQSLKPADSAPLFQHLQEINKEWQHYENQLTASTSQLTFNKDEDRIQLHLQLVHQILSAKNTTHLSQDQRTKRTQHLAVLAEYAQTAVFPKNSMHQKRQPYFVDSQDNACAVGYLLQEDGQTTLVNRIKEEKNFSYIAELVKDYPAIIEWANNNGFTTTELAWIQPTYLPTPTDWNPVGNDGGIEGHINVMQTSWNGELLYMAGDFTSVDGIAANNIIAWDGSDWQTFGDGVNGEIHDITSHLGTLYIVGNFELYDNPEYTNIATWNGSTWTGLQQGDMEGNIYDIIIAGSRTYIGGDFHKVDGQAIPYLAKKHLGNNIWNNEIIIQNGPGSEDNDTIPNSFSVDAPVYSFTVENGRILVAGEFTTTAPNVNSNNINTLSTDYMAYWNINERNWEVGFTGSHPPVSNVESLGGKIYLTGIDDQLNAVSIFSNGLWDNWSMYMQDPTVTSPLVQGFIEHNEEIFAYGDISNTPFLGLSYYGLIQLNSTSGILAGAIFDKTVRAAEVFQDNVYFAGDFTTSDGSNSFNGLTYSSLSPLTSVKNNNDIPIDIYSHNKQLYINYNNLRQDTELKVYTVQGSLICTLPLASGAAAIQEDLSRFADGILVFELTDGEHRSAGKISLF